MVSSRAAAEMKTFYFVHTIPYIRIIHIRLKSRIFAGSDCLQSLYYIR